MNLKELTLYEIDLLVELVKTKSIRELARRQEVTPSQISKALRKLEQKAKARLVERSVHGVVLTHEGLRILPIFKEILAKAEPLGENVTGTQSSVLAIGSTSFLVNHLLIPALSETSLHETLRLRFLEISPDQFTNAGLRNAFEIAFHFGKLSWPGTWHQEKIGDVGWSLCCGKNHPLTKKTVTEREALKWKFIIPSYWTQEGFALGNDGCPIPIQKRLKGHETSTAEGAMALVKSTDQIAYLPNILIRSFESSGEVKRLEIRGWDEVRPLFLTVRSDLVSEKQLKLISQAVKSKI
ncbi:MAG: LysR family transcriptional regulator [Bdellovibrionales bacterium]